MTKTLVARLAAVLAAAVIGLLGQWGVEVTPLLSDRIGDLIEALLWAVLAVGPIHRWLKQHRWFAEVDDDVRASRPARARRGRRVPGKSEGQGKLDRRRDRKG
jgi:hypothetical protein